MAEVHIDFETRSAADLKKVGAWQYAKHPSTEVICVGYKFGDHLDVFHIQMDDYHDNTPIPKHIRAKFTSWACNENITFVAHNAAFEQAVWRWVMVRKHNFPKIPPHRWRCTMAKVASYGLPMSLERAAEVLELDLKKDMEGQKALMKLCKPDKTGAFVKSDTLLETVKNYCKQDVAVEALIDEMLPALSDDEQQLWVYDQIINQRGFRLDTGLVTTTLGLVQQHSEALTKRLNEITRGYVQTARQNAKFLEWLEANGCVAPNMQAQTVTRLLNRTDLAPAVREALQLRQQLGRSSVSKLEAMLHLADDKDQRARGTLAFHAAGTGRWGGRHIQPQNMFRAVVDGETALATIQQGDYDWLCALYADPMAAMASSLRGMIYAKPGHDFFVADYSSIEARVTAWLAGHDELLALFTSGEDPYLREASRIYGRTITKKDKAERQIGKVATLALGYQGGIRAFATMARSYGVDLRPLYDLLWPTTTEDEKERAYRALELYKKRADEEELLPDEAALAADIVKQRWRSNNDAVVRLWHAMQSAATTTVLDGTDTECGPLLWRMRGDFLQCVLPSGRPISYFKPKVDQIETPWGAKTSAVTYRIESPKAHGFIRKPAYGGLLVENAVQGIARDILAEAIKRCEQNQYPVVLHVHDEVVCEIACSSTKSMAEFESLVAQTPDWAPDLPVSVEGWRGKRYRK